MVTVGCWLKSSTPGPTATSTVAPRAQNQAEHRPHQALAATKLFQARVLRGGDQPLGEPKSSRRCRRWRYCAKSDKTGLVDTRETPGPRFDSCVRCDGAIAC